MSQLPRQLCLLLPAALAALLAACNNPPPQKASPPYKPVATLEEVMHGLVIPSAQIVWKASGSIMTAKGTEERRPQNEDEWITVEAAAVTLMESGNLLMMEGRAKDDKKWMELCRSLVDTGSAVHKAAKARDVDALFTKGGDLFESCQNCHFAYRFGKDPNTIRTH